MRRMSAIAICAVIAGVLWPSPGSAQDDRVSEMVRQANELRRYCVGMYDGPDEFEAKECDRGIGIAEAAHRLDPASVEALAVLVDMLGARSQEKKADAARKLLALDPNNAVALRALSYAPITLDEQLRYLRRLAEVDPKGNSVYGDLAQKEFRASGDAAKALDLVLRQIDNYADHSNIWRMYSEFSRNGYTDEMAEILKHFLNNDLWMAGKCDDFFEYYFSYFDREEISDDSYGVKEPFLEQCGGRAYYRFAVIEADPAKKLEMLQKTVELLPSHPEASGELAVLLLASGRDVSRALREIKPQFRRNLYRAEEYLVAFAKLLEEKGSRDDYAAFMKSFVAEAPRGPLKCGLLKKLKVADYLDVPEIAETVGAECADLLEK